MDLDSSGDPQLKKQASVLDELLLSVAAPPNAYAERKDLEDKRIDDLKKRYEDPSKELHDVNKIADSEKAIEKSQMTKNYRIMESPLSTRYCPDHPGVQIARVGQNLWQCELDKKSYNYETGFELNNGAKVPGGEVNQQTQGVNIPYHAIFDTREGRLGQKTASADQNSASDNLKAAFEKAMKDLSKSDHWKNADKDKRKELASDLKEAIESLTGESLEMESFDESNAVNVIRRRPVVQEVDPVSEPPVSEMQAVIPEMLGEDSGSTDPGWLGLKDLINLKTWKSASQEEKIALLEMLQKSIQRK